MLEQDKMSEEKTKKDEEKAMKNVQDALNKLISDEWFAGNVYK